MYYYKIGWYVHDESMDDVLTHEIQFNEKEFKDMILSMIPNAIRLVKAEGSYLHSYADIHDTVLDLLIEQYGFKRLEYTSTWSCMSTYSMFEDNEYMLSNDEEYMVNKTVKDAGFSREEYDTFYNKMKIHDESHKVVMESFDIITKMIEKKEG